MSDRLPDNDNTALSFEAASTAGVSSSGSERSKQASDRDALSKWYLARLRRRAHMAVAGGNLTPAALIAADRERVERLIVENATDANKTLSLPAIPKSSSRLPRLLIFLAVGGIIQALLLFLTFIAPTANPIFRQVVAAISFAWIVLLALFARSYISKLKKLREEMLGEEVNVGPLQRIDELDCLRYLMQRREQTIEELKEKERAIVDYSDDVVCSFNADLKITSINPTPSRLLGYSQEELVGQALSKFILPEEIEKTEKSLNNARNMKREIAFENRLRKKDGSNIDLFWQAEWSRTANAFFCVAHDITIRKNNERTRQEFVAMLSHDLRSPLASIQGSLSLLRAGALGELNEQALNRIVSSERISNQLIRLINDLLDIEKIEAGKFELVRDEMPISEIIEQSAEAVQTLAEQKKVKIEIAKSDSRVFIDRDRLFRVIVNLLSNAIKFSPEGSTVSVEAEESKAFLEVRVKDKGRGIAKADQARIFDRFQQVEAADATIKGGSGLGLAICKAIVEKHGGTISVESELGTGSVFKFQLPMQARG